MVLRSTLGSGEAVYRVNSAFENKWICPMSVNLSIAVGERSLGQ